MSNLLVQNIKHTNGTTSQTINSSGIITYPNQICFGAVSTDNQTISSGTWTKVNLPSTEFNRGNAFDTSNSRFTPPVNGIYNFTTIGNFTTDTSDGGYIYFAVRKNGTIELYTNGMRLNSQAIQNDTQLNGCFMMELTTSDYTEFWAYQASGTSPVLNGGRCRFQGYLLA